MNNNHNIDHSAGISSRRNSSGQALILTMAIMLIASIVIFLVFNSGRAVNEKINLVNAADAAAYSGAQVAARQLNFMAYTNRAMIANELAIGHAFSTQMEADVAIQTLVGVSDFLTSILNWIPFIGPALANAVQTFVAGGMQGLSDATQVFTGAYASLVNANTAFYSSMQQEVYKDLVYPSEGRTLIESAMVSVANEYQLRPSARIFLNDQQTLIQFEDSEVDSVAAAARAASAMDAGFCQMILFTRPAASGSGSLQGSNSVESFCGDLAFDGTEGNQPGTAGNPVGDDGAILDMLRVAASEFGNAEWIRDRDSQYRVLGFNIRREGTTTVSLDGPNAELNWSSTSDSLRIGDPILNIGLATVDVQGDIGAMSAEAMNLTEGIREAIFDLFEAAGLCQRQANIVDDDGSAGNAPSCELALLNPYKGIRQYTQLNPEQTTPVVTAFLSQTSCGDTVGRDADGNRRENWHDGPRYLEESRPFCTGTDHPTVYAVAQAEVLFERPPCDDNNTCTYGFRDLAGNGGGRATELPNLFNPFWQARLRPQ